MEYQYLLETNPTRLYTLTMDMIKFENVTYRYHDATKNALTDVSFTVKKGEFVAVLGHNGSGKSTLAKLINGIFLATEGEVFVNSKSTKSDEDIWDIRRSCAMVFQNPDNQLIAATVEADVAFGPENLGLEPEEIVKRIDTALSEVEMLEYKKRVPAYLSGGQKQRVAIAGVLAMSPACIVFDEPTSMLDPEGRRDVMAIIKKLKSRGITILLITHHVEEAIMADRVLVMREGRLVLSGQPEEVFSKTEELRSYSLIPPQSVELAEKLIALGCDIEKSSLTHEDLVETICQLV